ncbi:MAG TPA: hypothetical protein VGK58_13445, partial [Lacipirellulaceae bacterium]
MKNTLPRSWAAAALLIASAVIALSGLLAMARMAQGANTSTGTAGVPADSSGDRLLVQALNQLERRGSVTARL